MPKALAPIQTALPHNEAEHLIALAHAEDRSVSSLVRVAIRKYLAGNGETPLAEGASRNMSMAVLHDGF